MACEDCEDYEIVARIWTQLGSPSYEQLAGRSIYDLIAEKDATVARLRARAAAIAADFQPSREAENGLALAAMREAIAALADPST
jgi:hypothetical protein